VQLRSATRYSSGLLSASSEHARHSRLACDLNRTRTRQFGLHHDIQSTLVYFDVARILNFFGVYKRRSFPLANILKFGVGVRLQLSRNLGNLIGAKSNFSPRGLISAYKDRQMLCTRCSTRSYRGPAGCRYLCSVEWRGFRYINV
jgi:hypothetical protein